jgi:hypothetical protein
MFFRKLRRRTGTRQQFDRQKIMTSRWNKMICAKGAVESAFQPKRAAKNGSWKASIVSAQRTRLPQLAAYFVLWQVSMSPLGLPLRGHGAMTECASERTSASSLRLALLGLGNRANRIGFEY